MRVPGCVFCAIVARESPAEIVLDTEHSLAFMDILPMTPGHTLVIPKVHARDLFAIDPDTLGHVMADARTVAQQQQAALRPLGVNLLHNTGAAADQSQFHFHVHVIPRFGDDRLLHPWERRFGRRDEIAAIAEMLRDSGVGHTQP